MEAVAVRIRLTTRRCGHGEGGGPGRWGSKPAPLLIGSSLSRESLAALPRDRDRHHPASFFEKDALRYFGPVKAAISMLVDHRQPATNPDQ